MEHSKTIVIVGGSGVFGSRLAAGLVQDGFSDVVIAGRNLARAQKVAAKLATRAVRLDISAGNLSERISDLQAWLVIDAAGPFQAYADYPLARSAIAVGAHYIDLSDDGPFTAGIHAALDDVAKEVGVVVRSGVSSVPAISAAAVRALSQDISDIALIETVMVPGNRAPRGLAVMKSILAQVGKPMVNKEHGWIGTRKARVAGLTRLASPIGAPDLHLMPKAFDASDVRFFAGLELTVMHRGLELLARAVKAGWLPDAAPLARVMRWASIPLYPFGSDQGGMRTRVVGKDAQGGLKDRSWTLKAIGGDGPHVPALPARVLTAMLRDGRLAPGATAELHDLMLDELEAQVAPLKISFSRTSADFTPHFQTCLGTDFERLPHKVKDLHHLIGRKSWSGRASVARGTGLASKMIGWIFRFPKAAADIPVTVHMDRTDTSEIWTRRFGDQTFRSELTPDPAKTARMWERFGLFTFAIDLKADETGLMFPVTKGRVFGLPIPRPLLPKSEAKEMIDAEGQAAFSVRLSVPFVGLIVHYQGWLAPAEL